MNKNDESAEQRDAHQTITDNKSLTTMPYSTPEYREPEHSADDSSIVSILCRVIAVIDFVGGAAVAVAIVDSPLLSMMASLIVLVVTSVTAWGLFRFRSWGWLSAMILHIGILAAGTIAYITMMVFLIRDFGRAPNHMEMISSEGAAVILSMIFALFALLATLPLLVLRTRRCRTLYTASDRQVEQAC